MALSPEERRKIYEEEKARIEARESLERERKDASAEKSIVPCEPVKALQVTKKVRKAFIRIPQMEQFNAVPPF